MNEKYQAVVFGKTNCDKCDALKKRLNTILKSEEWQDFEKVYMDMGTEDGLIAFSKAECINPQRIPALLIRKKNPKTDTYEPVPHPKRNQGEDSCDGSRLYSHLGLQTDYSPQGRGVISPKMIKQVLKEAIT